MCPRLLEQLVTREQFPFLIHPALAPPAQLCAVMTSSPKVNDLKNTDLYLHTVP